MKSAPSRILSILIGTGLMLTLSAYPQNDSRINSTIATRMKNWKNPLSDRLHIGRVKVDSVKDGTEALIKKLYFSTALSYYPLREQDISLINESVSRVLGRKFRRYRFDCYSNGFLLSDLIPNAYRTSVAVDSSRLRNIRPEGTPFIRKVNAEVPKGGLYGKSIALWHSHGYYYEMSLDRWEWQRARLFGVVEDISVMGYVIPYLAPLLENAGATVLMPRERDIQLNEVIVDNDKSSGKSEVVIHPGAGVRIPGKGFLLKDTLFRSENPFRMGSSLLIGTDSATFLPEIPEDGWYAVSVAYPYAGEKSGEVKYTVRHTGGNTSFLVNQRSGAGTWIPLGRFYFSKGISPESGSVVAGPAEGMTGSVGIDAVRFGGGMGNVARRPSPEIQANQRSVSTELPAAAGQTGAGNFTWKISGKPRYLEGSRYWLQYAGMPDTLVYSPNIYKNDYNDDYQSRGAWVNYLMASPGSRSGGLGIPVDLSFAFHTDAGVTPDDSVIGTLAIYSTASGGGKFPDGSSRMASRDLSDMIQTEIVTDIRRKYDREWTRRGLWDRPYAEARRPDVPAMLLELLSHQNQADQKLGLDPRFRYSVCRSVYKGILKYFAYNENRPYVVAPERITDFAIRIISGKRIRLSWKAATDTLEPPSLPDRYRICMRKNNGGFDNGTITDKNSAEIELGSYNDVYSFMITAINAGGESFPSEILSVGIAEGNQSPVLIVNGFDRISGPAWFDTGNMAGVAWWSDRGVADNFDISTVGDQYDFDRKSQWLDDDAPGWGASYADMEGKPLAGNTFDFTSLHGKSILAAGHSFVSVSDESFTSGNFPDDDYFAYDILMGEERSVSSFTDSSVYDFAIYTPEFIRRVTGLAEKNANIFISGSYIGSDLRSVKDSAAIRFAESRLHFRHRTGHAVNNGTVYATDYASKWFSGTFEFVSEYSPSVYTAEAPDAIEPAGKGAITMLRYSQNNTSAAVAFIGKNRIVAAGFPFETIATENERNIFMKQILEFFKGM